MMVAPGLSGGPGCCVYAGDAERLRLAALVLAVLAAGCAFAQAGGRRRRGARRRGTVEPFQPDPPAVYVAKVKNILVGLPPTDEEVAAVAADPAQLPALIEGWMALPQYSQKMLRFFELAFQQTQITTADFADQAGGQQISINATTTPLLMQNLQESFARTVLQLVAQGKPLSDAMSTQTFMMTTALKELYAFLDVWQVDDNGKVTDRFKAANPGLQITVGTASGADPHRRHAEPGQRQLHALVRPGRRDGEPQPRRAARSTRSSIRSGR